MSFISKKYTNENGFSIVEILIAVAILAVVTLGLMQVSLNSVSFLKKASNKNAELALQSEISQIISDSTFCKRAVVGKAPPLTNLTSPYKIQMKVPSVPGVLKDGTVIDNNVTINEFYVDNFSSPSPGPALGQSKVNGVFWMRASVSSESNVLQHAPRKIGVISLIYENSTKNVVDCYGQGLGPKETCESIGLVWQGGSCITPPNILCTQIGGTWTPGGCLTKTQTVSCPANEVVIGFSPSGTPICAPKPQAAVSCPANQVITGFTATGTPTCTPNTQAASCPVNQVMTGVSATGAPICKPISPTGNINVGPCVRVASVQWGVYNQCPGSYPVSVGVCDGGEDPDCNWDGGQGYGGLICCQLRLN